MMKIKKGLPYDSLPLCTAENQWSEPAPKENTVARNTA